MERSDLFALFLHFAMLSLMAVGGTNTVMPDMQRYVVEVNQWLTAKQFADAYALAQAAPGPNVMYLTLVGWQIGGWLGAITTTAAMLIPSAAVSLAFVHWHASNPEAPLIRAIYRGLAPVAIGLTLASAWVLVHSVNHDWRGYVLTVAAGALVLRTKWNPLWMIAGGAVAGMLGFV